LAATAWLVVATSSMAQDNLAVKRGEEFYDPQVVQTVHLDISEENLNLMWRSLPKRIYVPATFRWRDITVDNVGVRYKGNSSSNPNQRHKRSFLIKFSEYEKTQRFLGLRRASLDNGIQFGSVFSEPIMTEILRDQGVTTHRCNYARLMLNGEYHGVYVNVERLDQTFVENRLPDPNGALFKVDLGGPGANLQYLGQTAKVYLNAIEPKSKTARDEAERLVELIRVINQSPRGKLAEPLSSQMDVDEFLKVMSVMLFSGAFDQLTGWNAHNYYLYYDRDGGKWRYMPWDLDVGFCEIAFGRIRVLDDWHAGWPVPGRSPNPLLEGIVADPQLLQRYRATAKQVLEKYFEPDRLSRVLDAKYQLIKFDLASDPFPHQRATNPGDQDYDDIVSSMKTFMKRRYKTARAQLESPGERPQVVRGPPRGPQPKPGPASPDAPSELTVSRASSNAVELTWKDNAKGEIGTILQRAMGKDGEFRNHIGQPGGEVTSATDPRVMPGRTYRYRVYSIHRSPTGQKGTGVSNEVTVKVGGE
jgi:hypothetical protein